MILLVQLSGIVIIVASCVYLIHNTKHIERQYNVSSLFILILVVIIVLSGSTLLALFTTYLQQK